MNKIVVLVVLSALFIFYLPGINNSPIHGGQQSTHILLAKSMLSGQGYHEIWKPQNKAHTKFPFLYPALLIPIVGFFGYNFYIMRLVNLAFFILALWLFFLLLRRHEKTGIALGMTALAGVSFQAHYCITYIYPEMSYLFFSLLAILTAQSYFESRHSSSYALAALIISSLCVYFSRVVGISLCFAVLFFRLFIRKDAGNTKAFSGRTAMLALAILLPVALWVIRTYLIDRNVASDYTPYILKSFSQPLSLDKQNGLLGILAHNFYGYTFYQIPYALSGVEAPSRAIAGLMASFIVLTGAFSCYAKRKMNLVIWYLFFYIMAHSIFPASSTGKRYFFPIAPFILYFFLEGVRFFLESAHRKLGLRVDYKIGCFIILFIAAIFRFTALALESKLETLQAQNRKSEKAEADFSSAVNWVKKNTDISSVFLSGYSDDFYLYTGRKSLGPSPSGAQSDEAGLAAYINGNKCDYIFISPYSYNHYEKLYLQALRKSFALVYKAGSTEIYKAKYSTVSILKQKLFPR